MECSCIWVPFPVTLSALTVKEQKEPNLHRISYLYVVVCPEQVSKKIAMPLLEPDFSSAYIHYRKTLLPTRADRGLAGLSKIITKSDI